MITDCGPMCIRRIRVPVPSSLPLSVIHARLRTSTFSISRLCPSFPALFSLFIDIPSMIQVPRIGPDALISQSIFQYICQSGNTGIVHYTVLYTSNDVALPFLCIAIAIGMV